MSDAILQAVQQAQLKKGLPILSVGDTVEVYYRISEGSKERTQVFSGVIIKKHGGGVEQTITVRRIVANEGVERIFPVHSPKIARILVKRHGQARRAKLYYLRQRVGKKRRLKDRRRGLGSLVAAEDQSAGEAETEASKPQPPAATASNESASPQP